MATAYLQICINIESSPPVVSRVAIMSDGNPTTQFSRELWVPLLHMEGANYELAQSNVIGVLRSNSVMFGWLNPFFEGRLFPDLPLPNEPALELELEPVQRKSALERLGSLTFSDDEVS